MAVVRGLFGLLLIFLIAACQTASVTSSQTAMPSQPSTVVWGRVPYCNCLADSATDNVANALKDAKLTVDLKELSPRDGWLYFAVTFDPQSIARDQIDVAMKAGGAEVLEGPP